MYCVPGRQDHDTVTLHYTAKQVPHLRIGISAGDCGKRTLKVQKQKRISRSELVLRRLKASDPREVYAGLLWIVRLKGRKRGFAAHKYKAIFAEWPRFGEVEPEHPNSDLLTWLERERRRYGTAWKKQRMRVEAEARNASALALLRIEAILAELEVNPLAREPCCQQDSDGEALDIVGRICAKRAAVLDDAP